MSTRKLPVAEAPARPVAQLQPAPPLSENSLSHTTHTPQAPDKQLIQSLCDVAEANPDSADGIRDCLRDEQSQDTDLIQLLTWLQDKYPHRHGEIRACIEEIQEDMLPLPASPRDAVFEAVCMGRARITEIREKTKLTDWKVRSVLTELINLKLVRKKTADNFEAQTSQGVDPGDHYFPVH